MKFYLISPPTNNINFNYQNFDEITDIICVDYFQFRPKHFSINERINFVENHYENFSKICKKKKIKLIINNDFTIAKKFKFDGIHLGQEDKECREAKKEFGEDFVVGVSCSNSLEQYYEAEIQKADYVAFGPVFETKTKNKKRIDIESLIFSLQKLRLPFTLIGGINHHNFMQLLKYKPYNIAIINSFWNYAKGPVESAILFNKLLKEIK